MNMSASLAKRTTGTFAAFVVAALLWLLVLAPQQSQGHNATVWVTHPGGGSAAVINHHWFKVCDFQTDGHKAYIRYRAYGLNDTRTWGYAPSGGCSGVQHESRWISTFVACVQYEGCSRPEVP